MSGHIRKKRLPMVQVGDVILSPDCLTECFCCDLDACQGACCVEGDAGAPVTLDEVACLENVLEAVEDRLSPAALEVIRQQGVAYADRDGELVTSIVNGRDCAFACHEGGCCYCATEKAFREGKTDWCKPISCYLYPIRERKLTTGFTALNYHRWDICRCAVEKGRELGIHVYEFLKDPLIARFGREWYDQLLQTVEGLKKEGYL